MASPVIRRRVRAFLFIVYCLFILSITLFCRTPNTRQIDLRLCWSYREMFARSPNWKANVFQNIANILFFIPFGLLFPRGQLFQNQPWSEKVKWGLKPVLLSALVFSVSIETIQYIGALGMSELDDVICNTFGAVVGFWMRRVLSRCKHHLQKRYERGSIISK